MSGSTPWPPWLQVAAAGLLFCGVVACDETPSRQAADARMTSDVAAVATVCGDGVRGGTEACDGQDLAGRICTTEGFAGGTLACGSDCALDTTGCYMCGDGVVNGSEACDGTSLNGKSCQSEGFDSGTLACNVLCQLDLSGCRIATCGNGQRDAQEPCEGADLGQQTCTLLGFDGGTLTCDSNCAINTSGCFKCGDGTVNGQEQCDGSQLGGATCKTQGFQGGSLGCTATCTFHTAACFKCGDGVINGAEACDGVKLGGKTCQSLGYAGGTLTCKADCTLDATACQSSPKDAGTPDLPPTDAGGTSVTRTVSYVEPTSLAGVATCSTNGGALTNLDHTTIYYKINKGPDVTAAKVSATAPQGGGSISKQITITGLSAGTNQVTIWVTATSSTQQESDPACSQQVTLNVP